MRLTWYVPREAEEKCAKRLELIEWAVHICPERAETGTTDKSDWRCYEERHDGVPGAAAPNGTAEWRTDRHDWFL